MNAAAAPSWLSPVFLWTGAYVQEEELRNRIDAQFKVDFGEISPWLDFTTRVQVIDERPSNDVLANGVSFFGAGAYHNYTGSRILYGPLDFSGLPVRIRNIYRHGAPYAASHSRYSVELKTDPGSTSSDTLAVRLASPIVRGWQGFAAFADEEGRNSVSFGVNLAMGNGIQASAEGYYQEAVLPEQGVTGWFSDKRPLPEREARLYAGTAHFFSPFVSAAADIAYSETFAFGRGLYWNLGIQLGNRPWRFSLAADGVTPRFVDSAGSVPGEGFRVGGKIERFLPRGEVWRVETMLRGYGDGEDAFTRSATTLYYHFPTVRNLVALSQVSVSASRNAADSAKILDSWTGNIGVKIGNVRTKTSLAVGEYTHDDTPSPFPDRECTYVIYEWKLSEEAAVPFDLFTLTATLGCHRKLDGITAQWKDAELPFSVSVQLHNLPGRFTVKLSSPDAPDDWKLAVSWRFSYTL
jgi:hypothetical protein